LPGRDGNACDSASMGRSKVPGGTTDAAADV
jgi:hypothetical protein